MSSRESGGSLETSIWSLSVSPNAWTVIRHRLPPLPPPPAMLPDAAAAPALLDEAAPAPPLWSEFV